jgi:hypothetical protein
MRREPWLELLKTDPRPALLESAEPSARFVTLTDVLGTSKTAPEARAARKAVLADPGIRALADRLPEWDSGLTFGGHNSPGFPPNLLRLLYLLGVRAGDFPPIERLLDRMLRRQAMDGRFLTPGAATGGRSGDVSWTSLPCDHFAILEVLLLFGRGEAPQVEAAVERVRETFGDTAQGQGWLCIPDPVAKWRGPGRKNDICLQVTIEALRLFALVSASSRPKRLVEAAQSVLGAWRRRADEKPYMFGHGRRFADGKWPPTWYDASAVLEALASYPAVCKAAGAAPIDRRSVAEIARALASSFGPDGMVTPRSCYKGFEEYSFGQKKLPSPWATARLCGILRTVAQL